MDRDWRIIVNGEWFYGTKEACIRERAEFESTFTEEDFKDYEPVLPEQIHSLPYDVTELQRIVITQAAEIARLKEVTNFKDAVACVFDYLKFAAANTSDKTWDEQLEDLAEDVIEYSPEYKKQWMDICKLQGDLRLAIADKEAYGQNAIDLRQRLDNAIEMLYETSMAHSRIEPLLIN